MSKAAFSYAAYGVIQPTNEFMIAEDWEMIYFAWQPYVYCDVALCTVGNTAPILMPQMPDPRVAALLQSNAELEARNASLAQALDALRASTSWRITEPMRALRRSLAPRQTLSMRQE
ncbi:MAG TPA: hypothetical protein VNW90_17355 [Acetobacteraceae bacterium]|jgi:hypothetical protein|nr:hypothetical protein [Acetobacteraceae bacterium]